MDDQNRYEEIENKESVGTKIVKYFKGLGYDFLAGFKYNDLKLSLTITTGLAKYQNNMAVDDWINQADKLLYNGKNSGKNKTVI